MVDTASVDRLGLTVFPCPHRFAPRLSTNGLSAAVNCGSKGVGLLIMATCLRCAKSRPRLFQRRRGDVREVPRHGLLPFISVLATEAADDGCNERDRLDQRGLFLLPGIQARVPAAGHPWAEIRSTMRQVLPRHR